MTRDKASGQWQSDVLCNRCDAQTVMRLNQQTGTLRCTQCGNHSDYGVGFRFTTEAMYEFHDTLLNAYRAASINIRLDPSRIHDDIQAAIDHHERLGNVIAQDVEKMP